MRLNIKIDGGCKPNPGKGSIGIFGFSEIDKNEIFQCGLCLSKDTTNNQMEYLSFLGALYISQFFDCRQIKIFSDSQILINTYKNKNFQEKGKNPILVNIRNEIIKQSEKIGKDKIEVKWISRDKNKEADNLTNEAHENDIWNGLMRIDKKAFMEYLKSFINKNQEIKKESYTVLKENELKKGKLFYLVGLPRSGKSTFAEEWKKEKSNRIVLSGDSFRYAVSGKGFDASKEKESMDTLYISAKALLLEGYEILIDETNTRPESREKWKKLNGEMIYINTTLEECIKRVGGDPKDVSIVDFKNAIIRMNNNLIKYPIENE